MATGFRGRRARFCLRTIIRGWPWYYEARPVSRNEVLLRTVPNSVGYYTPGLGNWALNSLAFEPRQVDVDGISLFREDFVTRQHLASKSGHACGVRVARVTAKECAGLNLSVTPSPNSKQPPGHVVIPEMPFVKGKTQQHKEQRQEIKDLAHLLAQFANQRKVYVPPALPSPAGSANT